MVSDTSEFGFQISAKYVPRKLKQYSGSDDPDLCSWKFPHFDFLRREDFPNIVTEINFVQFSTWLKTASPTISGSVNYLNHIFRPYQNFSLANTFQQALKFQVKPTKETQPKRNKQEVFVKLSTTNFMLKWIIKEGKIKAKTYNENSSNFFQYGW